MTDHLERTAPGHFAPRRHVWVELTRAEIAVARDEGALVAIPTGAVEQHADHLPTGTDGYLAQRVAEMAAVRCVQPRVIVAPTVTTGFSPHHMSWPGTISLRLDTYLGLLRDTALSVLRAGFSRVVFVNGHGGNAAPLGALVGELITDGHAVGTVNYMAPGRRAIAKELKGAMNFVGHACEYETALYMVLDDAEVAAHLERTVSGLQPRLTQPWIKTGEDDPISHHGAGWAPVFEQGDCGYWGDPAAATSETGAALLEATVSALACFFEEFMVADLRTGGGWEMAPD